MLLPPLRGIHPSPAVGLARQQSAARVPARPYAANLESYGQNPGRQQSDLMGVVRFWFRPCRDPPLSDRDRPRSVLSSCRVVEGHTELQNRSIGQRHQSEPVPPCLLWPEFLVVPRLQVRPSGLHLTRAPNGKRICSTRSHRRSSSSERVRAQQVLGRDHSNQPVVAFCAVIGRWRALPDDGGLNGPAALRSGDVGSIGAGRQEAVGATLRPGSHTNSGRDDERVHVASGRALRSGNIALWSDRQPVEL